jgi:hypothetical protein
MFSTSAQFKNNNLTVEWRFEHLDGFQWSVGVIDDMLCSDSQSGLSGVKGVRFLYRCTYNGKADKRSPE